MSFLEENLGQEILTRTFRSQIEFEAYLEVFQKNTHVCLRRRSSKTNKNVASSTQLPFKYMRYECIHYGLPRRNVKDGSRPNQKTNARDCKYHFVVELSKPEEGEPHLKLCGSHALFHNHQTSHAVPTSHYTQSDSFSSFSAVSVQPLTVISTEQAAKPKLDATDRYHLFKPTADLHMSTIMNINQLSDAQFLKHLNTYKQFVAELVALKEAQPVGEKSATGKHKVVLNRRGRHRATLTPY
jgi:hypothetical protein